MLNDAFPDRSASQSLAISTQHQGLDIIHVYPGMGATRDMYSGSWHSLRNCRFHNWPSWQGEESIGDVAERLIREHSIKEGDTIIGASLGGIVGCEIANRVSLQNLVLIGSAVEKDEISRLLRFLHPLVDLIPLKLAKRFLAKIPNQLARTFAQSDLYFIQSMCKAIFRWDGLKASVPVTRLHGKKDPIISRPGFTHFMFDCGHFIATPRETECVEIVKRSQRKVGKIASFSQTPEALAS